MPGGNFGRLPLEILGEIVQGVWRSCPAPRLLGCPAAGGPPARLPSGLAREILVNSWGGLLGRLPWQSLGISCKPLGILDQLSGAHFQRLLRAIVQSLREIWANSWGHGCARTWGHRVDVLANSLFLDDCLWESLEKSCQVSKWYCSIPSRDLGRLLGSRAKSWGGHGQVLRAIFSECLGKSC